MSISAIMQEGGVGTLGGWRRRASQARGVHARLAIAVSLAAGLACCGCAGLPFGRKAPAPAPHPVPTPVKAKRPSVATVTDLGALLPTPLAGTAAATLGGRIYLIGGSGPAGFSAGVYAFSPPSVAGVGVSSKLAAIGRLPQALHDGAAAAGASAILFCGGGQSVGTPSVYVIDGAGAVRRAGSMPRVLSDMAGAEVGGRPYCAGGWTGHLYSDQVYDVGALASGSSRVAPVTAHLPHAVRYGAAVPFPGGLLMAGGLTYSGAPTDDLQWVPLGGSGTPSVVGHLPGPVSHAMAASLRGTGLVIGGCDGRGQPVGTIDAVTARGAVRQVGSLPTPLCYGSAATLGNAVYVFGGQTAGGRVTDHVWRITLGPAGGGAGAGSAGSGGAGSAAGAGKS